jgi:hypothetical protein
LTKKNLSKECEGIFRLMEESEEDVVEYEGNYYRTVRDSVIFEVSDAGRAEA